MPCWGGFTTGAPIPRTNNMALANSCAPVDWRLAQRTLPTAEQIAATATRTITIARIAARMESTCQACGKPRPGAGEGRLQASSPAECGLAAATIVPG